VIIKKSKLANLNKIYAVNHRWVGKELQILAASEEMHGKALIFNGLSNTGRELFIASGGAMSFVPIPNRNHQYLIIQGFFPVFDSANAHIVYVENLQDGSTEPLCLRVLDIPYVHRFEVVMVGKSAFVIASSLCEKKEDIDDWTYPGSVFVAPIPDNPRNPWQLIEIYKGISKNHGMFVTDFGSGSEVLISGQEGLFSVMVPKDVNEKWCVDQILHNEISDVAAADLDGCGMKEIVTIESFHGNTMRIYKLRGDTWREVYEGEMNFGHVIWAGKIGGRPSILLGNRDGLKDLSILRPKNKNLTVFEKITIDQKIAPTMITVINDVKRTYVISANHPYESR
jgi:hypothetical protein